MVTEALASGADVDIIDLKVKQDSKLSKEMKVIKNKLKEKYLFKMKRKSC